MNSITLFKTLNKVSKKFLSPSLHSTLRDYAIDLYCHTQEKSISIYPIFSNALSGKSGLEVGGPSWIWKTLIPVYRDINSLDNVNWASTTANNPYMTSGPHQYRWYLNKRGYNYICEADSIPAEDSKYDFIISAQVLEHIANPIKSLYEWRRLLRHSGHIICEVPNKEKTFDYKRKITTLEHIVDDFKNGINHDDLTHLEEVVELKDDFLSPNYKTKDELRRICSDNINNRLMHHHVFDLNLLISIMEKVEFKIVYAGTIESGHIVLAKK
jgi:SAM-dependent methyltransferase